MLFELAIFVPVFDFYQVLRIVVSCAPLRIGGVILGNLTPITIPICTSPGIFRALPDSSFPALRPHSMRAFSSVAISIALKGILLALRMVSMREVAVTIWDDPDVRDV